MSNCNVIDIGNDTHVSPSYNNGKYFYDDK